MSPAPARMVAPRFQEPTLTTYPYPVPTLVLTPIRRGIANTGGVGGRPGVVTVRVSLQEELSVPAVARTRNW